MTCPASDFVEESFLLSAKRALHKHGLFVVNLVSRSPSVKDMVVSRMKKVRKMLYGLTYLSKLTFVVLTFSEFHLMVCKSFYLSFMTLIPLFGLGGRNFVESYDLFFTNITAPSVASQEIDSGVCLGIIFRFSVIKALACITSCNLALRGGLIMKLIT